MSSSKFTITAEEIINMGVKKTPITWTDGNPIAGNIYSGDREYLYNGFTDDVVAGGWLVGTNAGYECENSLGACDAWDLLAELRNEIAASTTWCYIDDEEAERHASHLNAVNV